MHNSQAKCTYKLLISQKPRKVNPLFRGDSSNLSATLKMERHPNPSLATQGQRLRGGGASLSESEANRLGRPSQPPAVPALVAYSKNGTSAVNLTVA